jgi:hypothetical protein
MQNGGGFSATEKTGNQVGFSHKLSGRVVLIPSILDNICLNLKPKRAHTLVKHA